MIFLSLRIGGAGQWVRPAPAPPVAAGLKIDREWPLFKQDGRDFFVAELAGLLWRADQLMRRSARQSCGGSIKTYPRLSATPCVLADGAQLSNNIVSNEHFQVHSLETF